MPQLLGDLMTREWTGVVEAAVADQDGAASSVDRLVATIVGAATLPFVQLPNVFDIGI